MAHPDTPPAVPPPKLLDQVRDLIRLKHYSIRTEALYVQWVRRFILFHGKRHPREMGGAEVEAFLTHLAVEGGVAAATQNQALSALLFLYREVLGVDLPWLDNVTRAKKPQRLPTVLSVAEVAAVLERMEGTYALMARLLYGTGMRLMECVRLRVKDLDFGRRETMIRDGKGAKDRVPHRPDGADVRRGALPALIPVPDMHSPIPGASLPRTSTAVKSKSGSTVSERVMGFQGLAGQAICTWRCCVTQSRR